MEITNYKDKTAEAIFFFGGDKKMPKRVGRGQFKKGEYQGFGFKKGKSAWNKNIKGIHLSPKSEFKKGVHYSIKTEFKKGQKPVKPIKKGEHIGLGTEFTREKVLGKNNPNWKGGISSLNQQIRHCFKMRQWISDIFTRDDFTCQKCSIRGGKLEAHHIKEFSIIIEHNKIKTIEQALDCEELWNINNGRTLCRKCHRG